MKDIHKEYSGVVCPLGKNNVDTDQIIPKQFLTSVSREGFDKALFYDWRYHPDGSPVQSFVLNHPVYADARILLSGENFGCGSSREHAPWALKQFGFKTIIAASFADIFFSNSANNGMLLIQLDATTISELIQRAEKSIENWQIDLPTQKIQLSQQESIDFAIDPDYKSRLLGGLDFIGVSEQFQHDIDSFSTAYRQQVPWISRAQ